MGLIDDATRDITARAESDDAVDPVTQGAESVEAVAERAIEVDVAGETVTIDEPDTKQPDDGGDNWLTGDGKYGRPRGVDAVENRQIVQTSAMQSIVNGIVDQLLGGELAFETDDEQLEELSASAQESVTRLRRILRDVITGPHLQDEDLDDLITAAVEDMLGPGNAYWQLLAPEDSTLPVVSLTTLDPLTIRHNVNKHGYPQDPPYWQAPNAYSNGSIANLGSIDPVALQTSDLAVMRYPRGNRSYKRYPISPSWQVKEWLEILANSTDHHNRFYSDNEIPPGLLQIIGASENTVKDVKQKIEDASGDPRNAPVIGGEGGAQWLDLGGTSVNLDVISEQQWFYELCLGALGLGKSEVGMIEDVNRSNGEIEASRVYKRVTGPFAQQFENAFLHIARQFDAFTDLGEPFRPKLRFTDPREERAREERLREMYQAGGLTLREYVRRRGDSKLAEDEERYTVQIGDETVDYGAHPKWVSERLLSSAGATDSEPAAEDDESEQGFRNVRQEGPFTDYPQAASENAQMALDARDETGNPNDCGTAVGWARANQLVDREALSEETVRRMAAFRRHEDNAEMDDDEGRADCGWMMWNSWGGEEGISWAERKVEQWDEED